MDNVTIIPVILCGGSGTRLWPASREAYPKQFLNLMGDKSLLQDTAQRALNITKATPDQLVTVTLGMLKKDVERQLNEISPQATRHILSEPLARNTAAAVALAASYVAETFGPEALMWILPADHHIGAEPQLAVALAGSIKPAQDGYMMTFGIQPTRPDTGYGYLCMGKRWTTQPGVSDVKEFVEKPDYDTATAYVASGDYLWNSGMFLFKADAVLREFVQHAPKILFDLQQAVAAGSATTPDTELYAVIEQEPFDKAIMEKTTHVAVVPCDPEWSDIGSWESLWELRDKDASGNVITGRVAQQASNNCLIESKDRLIACAGLENMVIIDTGDAILIADRRNPDALKALVKDLKLSGAPEVCGEPDVQKTKVSAASIRKVA